MSASTHPRPPVCLSLDPHSLTSTCFSSPTMYCMRWWIPIFLLPFPAAPPAFVLLFLLCYTLYTRPCVYCGAIVLGLVLSSCYFTTPYEPASLSVPASWMHTRIGFGLSRFVDWLVSPASKGAPHVIEPHAGCSSCFATLNWTHFFTPLARRPYCETGAVYPQPRTSLTQFIGVPGTALGFELDWSLFIS